MRKLHVIIAEDHPIFRDGIYVLLSTFSEIEHIELSSNGLEFLEKIKHSEYDLALVDVKMPHINGIEAIQQARLINQNLKFIVISAFESAEYIDRALAAGASAYLLKDADQFEIKDAIRKVIDDQNYFSPRIMQEITTRFSSKINRQYLSETIPSLTDREYEILQMICLGYNRQDIAHNLFISERTFDKHKENILSKTNTSNSVSLVLFAIKNRLVDISI
jgi:DNA-binding NarL/FixJ family response regulator